MTTTHFTAWLTTTTSALDQDNIDIVILEDELIGDPEAGDAAWACKGGIALFTGITNVPAEDGDHTKAKLEAEDLMRDAGWATVGAWDGVDTGYIVTVERV
ncbi:hypothetical protein [Streptomyces sp. NBC_01353]|uniref:hypothetical protein n=1 Tax=Streptomyces sp. NBC_01353 TaxID=2903835 RepID=UPI002E3623ED|nr:hypothetical protein [Streptomyces sp. NBC_01353]